jgi:hypothetical protein
MPSRGCSDVAHTKSGNYAVWVCRVEEHAVTLPAAVLSFVVLAGLLTVMPGLDTALATALGINRVWLFWSDVGERVLMRPVPRTGRAAWH